MTEPEQEELEGGKTLCIYQDSIHAFTYVTRSQSCPYSKTFDSSEDER